MRFTPAYLVFFYKRDFPVPSPFQARPLLHRLDRCYVPFFATISVLAVGARAARLRSAPRPAGLGTRVG